MDLSEIDERYDREERKENAQLKKENEFLQQRLKELEEEKKGAKPVNNDEEQNDDNHGSNNDNDMDIE